MRTRLRQILNDFVWYGRRFGDQPDTWKAIVFSYPRSETIKENVFVAQSGTPLNPQHGNRIAAGSSICIFEGRPVSVQNVAPWKATLGIPLRSSRHSIIGNLALVYQWDREWTHGDVMAARPLAMWVLYELLPADQRYQVSRRLGETFRHVRERQQIIRGTLASRIGVPERLVTDWEAGRSLPGPAHVLAWSTAIGLALPPKVPIVRIVPSVTSEMLRFLKENPNNFRHITPEQFEHFVADRLERAGYSVTLAGSTFRKDGGVDLIAVPRQPGIGSFMLAGQVKHHREDVPTRRADVDRLLSLKNGAFSVGLLITNTRFTADAKWIATQQDNRFFARLRDLEDIKRWLEGNFTTIEEVREIPDEIELAPGVRIRVPRPHVTDSRIWLP